MFTHINHTLLFVIKKRGIQDKINTLNIKGKAEHIIWLLIKQKVKALKLNQHTLFIKVKNNHVASEVRLKEKKILQKLNEEKSHLQRIKCTL